MKTDGPEQRYHWRTGSRAWRSLPSKASQALKYESLTGTQGFGSFLKITSREPASPWRRTASSCLYFTARGNVALKFESQMVCQQLACSMNTGTSVGEQLGRNQLCRTPAMRSRLRDGRRQPRFAVLHQAIPADSGSCID